MGGRNFLNNNHFRTWTWKRVGQCASDGYPIARARECHYVRFNFWAMFHLFVFVLLIDVVLAISVSNYEYINKSCYAYHMILQTRQNSPSL